MVGHIFKLDDRCQERRRLNSERKDRQKTTGKGTAAPYQGHGVPRGRPGLATNKEEETEEEEESEEEDGEEEILERFNTKDGPYRKCSDT